MPGFNPLSIGAPSPVGRGGAGGRLFIARRFFYASGTDTVPDKAALAIVRCIGQGGGSAGPNPNYSGGGGGAYARNDVLCAPGQTATITIGAMNTGQFSGGDGQPTTVFLNNMTTTAAGGKTGISNTGGAPGLAADSIGRIRRNGGYGSGPYGQGAAGDGGGAGSQNWGNSQNQVFGGGGGSGGDRVEADSIRLGGDGGFVGCGGTPGGGGGGIWNSAYVPSGMAVIEYWSA